MNGRIACIVERIVCVKVSGNISITSYISVRKAYEPLDLQIVLTYLASDHRIGVESDPVQDMQTMSRFDQQHQQH